MFLVFNSCYSIWL